MRRHCSPECRILAAGPSREGRGTEFFLTQGPLLRPRRYHRLLFVGQPWRRPIATHRVAGLERRLAPFRFLTRLMAMTTAAELQGLPEIILADPDCELGLSAWTHWQPAEWISRALGVHALQIASRAFCREKPACRHTREGHRRMQTLV
jgi:hypothetical protein